VTVDTWTYPVRAADVILLCSDGLTSMVSEAQVAEILRTNTALDRAAQGLIDEANRAGGRDNITVILVRLEEVGTGLGSDQPTVVAAPPSSAPAANATGANATGVAVAPPPAPRAVRSAPIARTQGPPTGAGTPRPRRNPRYAKPVAAVLAVLIVLFLFGGGGWLATRQLFFLGTNSQGMITIYRGLPYNLIAGVRLYEIYYESGVPASTLPPAERSRILDDDLRSQVSAQNLVNDLELGKVQP
jgi:protein phosphatase